jgi:uncharacterized protein with von Willebrand factor type A (vWA) domain
MGRAYYASLDNLGGYIFEDYIRNRKKRVRWKDSSTLE